MVAVEGIFTWYWLAELGVREGRPFVLGPALSMKASHGGTATNDRIEAQKVAVLLRGGLLPQASVYPAAMRATRDLLRRRLHLMRQRAELLTHVQQTHSQDNWPSIGTKSAYKTNRTGVAERLADPAVQKSIEVDLALLDYDDQLLRDLELASIKGCDRAIPKAYAACCPRGAPSPISTWVPGIGCDVKYLRWTSSQTPRNQIPRQSRTPIPAHSFVTYSFHVNSMIC